MGKGFQVKDRAPLASCPNVYLIATGTGIAPIRALINSGELDIPNRESVALYYGYRNQDYCAYSEEIESWVSHLLATLLFSPFFRNTKLLPLCSILSMN